MAVLSAKQLRALVSEVTAQPASGATGACLVVRHQEGTKVTCVQTTKGHCTAIDTRLGNDGHAIYLGDGTRCR